MRRYWNLLRRNRVDRDIAEELATHAALLEEANRVDGTARRLGSDLALRERVRLEDVPVWLDELLRDLGFAARSLWRSRGFTLVAIVTLALGIGATTAMYSVVRTFVLRTLPYPQASHLVRVEGAGPADEFLFLPASAIEALRHAHIFARMGTDTLAPRAQATVYIRGYAVDAEPDLASQDWFPTLGVRPLLGHNFHGTGKQAIVSQHFFQKELGGKRSALGEPLRVGDVFYTIVGVLPEGQQLPPLTDVWLSGTHRADGGAMVVARLGSDHPLALERARASAAVAVVGQRIRSTKGPYAVPGLMLTPLHAWRFHGKANTAFWALFAAAACLLLIGCLNTANLLLARGLDRGRELAVRRALGASRLRLLRLLLAEGLWLALISGIFGGILAWVLVALVRLGPTAALQLGPLSRLLRLDFVRLGSSALALAAGLAVLCGLLCALAPALRLSRRGGGLDPLHGGAQVTRTQALRRFLVAAEVAVTLALLAGGLLLTRSFANLEHVTLGFNPAQVVASRIVARRQVAVNAKLPRVQFRSQRIRLFVALQRQLAGLPGVSSVGYARMPLFWRPVPTAFGHVRARQIRAGAGYFRTLEIPLLAGRGFRGEDILAMISPTPHRGEPVVINAALARAMWPRRKFEQLLGLRVHDPKIEFQIIGVAGNVNDELGDLAPPTLYTPFPGIIGAAEFFLRSTLPPGALGAEVRAVLPKVSTSLTLSPPVPVNDTLQGLLAWPRFRAALVTLFAALAWLLALVGLYGVLAYQVRRRRREIGVRMALGAGEGAVVRLVLGQSAAVLAVGIAAGWLLCWFLSRYISSLLFGVSALDPLTWLAAGAAMMAAGLLASIVPARRALHVDAAETLRCE